MTTQSRNKREGHYDGYVHGGHHRLYMDGKPRILNSRNHIPTNRYQRKIEKRENGYWSTYYYTN